MPPKKRERNSVDAVKAFKIADPIAQTLLLIWYFYSLEEMSDNFRRIFFILLGLQLLSFAVNAFLKFHKKLKIERLIYLLLTLVWCSVYYYVKTHVREVQVSDADLSVFAKTGIHDFYLMFAGYCWLLGISPSVLGK